MPLKPRRILEAAVYARDLDAAERFYGDLLGLERMHRAGDRHVFYRCGDGVLLVFNSDATRDPSGPVPAHGADGPGHVCFAASAAELDAWRVRLTQAGVTIEADLRWPGGGRSLYVRDPAGNSIEFSEPAIWGLPG